MINCQNPASKRRLGDKSYDITYLPLGSAGWGGAERSLLDLAARSAARGKRILILAERALERSPFCDEARSRDIDIRWVDWAPERSFLDNLRSAFHILHRLDTRVIHFNISWRRGMCWIPLLARALTSAKLVGSMRAMPDLRTRVARKRYLMGLVPGLQLWIVPDLLRGRVWARTMHVTVSVNRSDYPPRLISEYGFRPERLDVIYNGVEIPARLPTEDDRQSVRSQLGVTDEHFVVCYFGRIASEKGIKHLLVALPGCPAHVRLVVIGEGPDEERLKALCLTLGLSDRVLFVGFVARPEPIVAACDLVAVPSTWNEAFGRTVVEALSYQVPVVASRVGGMAELFVDREHGFYVPPADPSALREAITEFASDPTAARRMGIKGREWVAERYSMERVARDYSILYDNLLAKSPSA